MTSSERDENPEYQRLPSAKELERSFLRARRRELRKALRKYVTALDGRLEIVAKFPEGEVLLKVGSS